VKLIDLADQSMGEGFGDPSKLHGGAVGSVSQVPLLLGTAALSVVVPLRFNMSVHNIPDHPEVPVSVVFEHGAQSKKALMLFPEKLKSCVIPGPQMPS
jgi:hypothetical protein